MAPCARLLLDATGQGPTPGAHVDDRAESDAHRGLRHFIKHSPAAARRSLFTSGLSLKLGPGVPYDRTTAQCPRAHYA